MCCTCLAEEMHDPYAWADDCPIHQPTAEQVAALLTDAEE